jgi:hypothetical protein
MSVMKSVTSPRCAWLGRTRCHSSKNAPRVKRPVSGSCIAFLRSSSRGNELMLQLDDALPTARGAQLLGVERLAM